MSKLEELIKKLCPNGVEYKTIKECTKKVENIRWKLYDGKDKKYIDLTSVDINLHTITNTQNINSNTAPSRAQQILMENDVILGTTRPMLKRYCIIPKEYNYEICSTGFCVLRAKTEKIYPKWLYYNISTEVFFAYVEQNQQGASYPSISDSKIREYKLPVPPLEVQREIVRVLDNFTFLTTELAAELAARQKQYEYYRDLLLTFKLDESTILNERTNELELNGSVRWMKLGDIADVTKLAGFEFTKYIQYSDNGKIIAIRGLNVKKGKLDLSQVKYIDNSDFNKLSRSKLYINDIIFTYVGTVGQVGLVEENDRFYLAPNVARIRLQSKVILPKFLLYYFQCNEFIKLSLNRYMNASSMSNLTMENIRKFSLPVPPLREQCRIVSILDRFDVLCNDITSGLPAEIAMRQKEYEYYRDKLLTFKEKEA